MPGSERLIENHRAKAAFRESEEHYRAVAEAATDAIITIDSDSTIRLEMKKQFARAVCRIVETRPDTTYDNFARDFGERFVPGYRAVSTVEYLLNSPFEE